MNKYVICKACGWIHFEVSLEYLLEWQDSWIDHWLTMSKDSRKNYGVEKRPPSYKNKYLNCRACGCSHKNFRKARKKEIPTGSTIGPILTRKAFPNETSNI